MRIFEFCFRVFTMPTAVPDAMPARWWGQKGASLDHAVRMPAHGLNVNRSSRGNDKKGTYDLSEPLLNLAASVNSSAGSKMVLIDAPPLDIVRKLEEVHSTQRFQRVFRALLARSRTLTGRRKRAWAECAAKMLVPARCAKLWCWQAPKTANKQKG
jgi:hypothetical protein